MFDSILPAIYFSGGLFSLFFAVLLFGRSKPNRRSNRFLACFILVLGILLFDQRSLLTGGYHDLTFLIGLAWPSTSLMMPLLYLYAFSLAFKQKLKWYQYGHFLLFLFYFSLMIPFYLEPSTQKLATIYGEKPYGFYLWQIPFISLFQSAQLIFYSLLSIRLIRRHDKKLEETLSEISSINLGWIKKLFLGFLIALLTSTFSGMSEQAFNISQMIMYLFMIGLMLYLGFNALQEKRPSVAITEVAQQQSPKYDSSKLDSSTADKIKSHLEKIMDEHAPWKQADINLEQLAQIAGVKSHHLSQVLNTGFQQNFYEFINQYRIEEFCRQSLLQPALSTTELIYEIGFNSRPAFYRAFRRINGVTPTEWRKSLK